MLNYLWWLSSTLSGDVANRKSQSWITGAWSSSDARQSCVATSGCHATTFQRIYAQRQCTFMLSVVQTIASNYSITNERWIGKDEKRNSCGITWVIILLFARRDWKTCFRPQYGQLVSGPRRQSLNSNPPEYEPVALITQPQWMIPFFSDA
jgi:hypothetical protein